MFRTLGPHIPNDPLISIFSIRLAKTAHYICTRSPICRIFFPSFCSLAFLVRPATVCFEICALLDAIMIVPANERIQSKRKIVILRTVR